MHIKSMEKAMQNIIIFRRCVSAITYSAFLGVFYLYAQNIGFSPTLILMLYSILLFSNQASALLAGMFGDKYGVTKLMLIGCVTDVFAYLLLCMTNSEYLVILGMMGIGVGGCLFSTNARAVLIELFNDNRQRVMAQGRFLRATNLGTLLGSLVALLFIWLHALNVLLVLCLTLEFLLCLLMINRIQFLHPNTKPNHNISMSQSLLSIFSPEFIKLHVFSCIPFALVAAFPIIFPYLLSTLLHKPEQIAIAQFFNATLLVVMQQYISQRLQFTIRHTCFLLVLSTAILVIFLLLATLYPSLAVIYLFLLVFTVIESMVITLLANTLVIISKNFNRGTVFGSSKLIMALTTPMVINFLPFFMAASRSFLWEILSIIAVLTTGTLLTMLMFKRHGII